MNKLNFEERKKEAFEIALNYQVRSDFKNNECKYYKWLYRYNLLNEACKHMPIKKIEWTIEKSIDEAKKHEYKCDFKKNSERAYRVLLKNNLLNEACKHMLPKPLKWTKDKCIEAAKSCEHKSEFLLKFCGAYKISKQRGWFEELEKYFEPIGSKVSRCIYVYEFSDNYFYVGLTFNLKKRNLEHLYKKDSAVFQHIMETGLQPILKQLTDYINYKEAIIKEDEWLNIYLNNGWKKLNKICTGGLGSNMENIK